MKNFFFALLLFFSTEVCSADLDWVVKGIKFEGLKNVSKQDIMHNISFNIGDKLSSINIQKNIKSLFNTNKFEKIEFLRSSDILIIKFKECPIVSSISYIGNKLVSNEIIIKHLNFLNIHINRFLNMSSLNLFQKELKQFYIRLGRYDTIIKILTYNTYRNHIIIKIIISEGSSKVVNKVIITGNSHFLSKQLFSYFKFYKQNFFIHFRKKSVFYPNLLSSDLKNLYDFYHNQGYIDFNIEYVKIHLSEDKKSVTITIQVDEGEQFCISKILVHGYVPLFMKKINHLVIVLKNSCYNKYKIKTVKNSVIKLFNNNGFINADISFFPEINFYDKKVLLHINIVSGQQIFVHNIYFIGNYYTQDQVLRRELTQLEGSVLSTKLLQDSITNLKKLNFLKTVYFNIYPVVNIDNQVDIVYTVEEKKDTGTLNFSTGYSATNGLNFNIGITQENILGLGKSVNITGIKNGYQNYAELSINNPFFTIDGTILNHRIYFNRFKNDFNNSKFNFNKNSSYGIDSTLKFILNETNQVNLGIGYVHNYISDINTEFSTFHNFDTLTTYLKDNRFADFSINNLIVNYALIHDSLYSNLFPIYGNKTELVGKLTLPQSDNNFYKIQLDTQEHFSLNQKKDFILSIRSHIGYGDMFTHEQFPFYENFFINQNNYIRGFNINSLGPKSAYRNMSIMYNDFSEKKIYNSFQENPSIGGNAIMITNLELVLPNRIFKNYYSKFFRTLLFMDSGAIWNTQWKNVLDGTNSSILSYDRPNQIHVSLGASLEFITPIGPITLSYSKPLKQCSEDQIESFQFNIGKIW